LEEKIFKILNQLLDGQKKLEDGQQKLEDGQKKLEEGQQKLENQVAENTQILKALEHAAQVNKAEIDKLSFEVAEIKGEVIAIRKDLSAVEVITAKNWSDINHLKAIR